MTTERIQGPDDRQDGERDFYHDFFARSPDAYLIIENETFVDCNQAAVAMLRCETREQLLRTHPSELSPERQPDGRLSYEKANEMIGTALREGWHRFHWDHRRADGEVFPVEVTLTAVPRLDGVVIHTTWRDLTERRRLEDELRQAQKMEAVGKLTGGIAHDFNNILASILGNAELMDLEMDPDSPLREGLDEIRAAGDRAAELVSQLLAFSRRQMLRTAVFDLGDVLRQTSPMLRHLIGEDILTEVSAWSRALPVRADASQLQQVVLNLATNARDAMPGGGRLTMETFPVTLEAGDIAAGSPLTPGPHAALRVTDDGVGIPPQDLGRIFEPFFTTKAKGTGLGLATSHGIVQQSRGDLVVFSEPGRGTTVTLYLPLTTEGISTAPRPRPHPSAADGHGETVLLVEDEPSVALLAERVLGGAGYRVVCAANGRRALELVDREGLRFDLLFTDVIMPGMNGPQLVEHLRARIPDLKVLYASGYTDDALSDRGALAPDVELLRKPYGVNDLKKRVRAVLDGVAVPV